MFLGCRTSSETARLFLKVNAYSGMLLPFAYSHYFSILSFQNDSLQSSWSPWLALLQHSLHKDWIPNWWFSKELLFPQTPHEASLKVLFEAMTTVVNARFERLSFRPKVAHNSEVCWHCGAAASRRARSLSDELQKRQGSSPQRQAGPHLWMSGC